MNLAKKRFWSFLLILAMTVSVFSVFPVTHKVNAATAEAPPDLKVGGYDDGNWIFDGSNMYVLYDEDNTGYATPDEPNGTAIAIFSLSLKKLTLRSDIDGCSEYQPVGQFFKIYAGIIRPALSLSEMVHLMCRLTLTAKVVVPALMEFVQKTK